MKRLILLLTLLCCSAQAADVTIVRLVGPTGELPSGSYRYVIVTIPSDVSKPVTTTEQIINVGNDVPTPPVPPPIVDIDAKLNAFLVAVNDQDKASTAKALAIGYSTQVGFANAGIITTVEQFRQAVGMTESSILQKDNKTAGWKPWTDGLTALAAPMSLAEALAVYKLAATKLGALPPVPPPTPPPTTAVKAAILIQTEGQKPEQATLLQEARNDKTWSKLIQVVDPDEVDQDDKPSPVATKLKAAAGSEPLPRLILLDGTGGVVGSSLALPATWDALKKLLTEKGVKP